MRRRQSATFSTCRKMRFVYYLVFAVILCSLLGCCYDDLQPCTNHPGYLYILSRTTGTKDAEEGRNVEFEIVGSSGVPPSDRIAGKVGDVAVEEQGRVAVYHCIGAFKSAYSGLERSTVTASLTNTEGECKLSLSVPVDQIKKFFDAIADAVALWTDNDRWKRTCTHDSGYVYLQRICPEIVPAKSNAELIYRIIGSSGRAPTHKIERISKPMFLEDSKFRVRDCGLAIGSILLDLMVNFKSGVKISRTKEYSDYAFSLPQTEFERFHGIIKSAIFNLLLAIPKIDWFSCKEGHAGYLYIARVELKTAVPDEVQYHCDRIFGSTYQISSYKFKMATRRVVYSEVENYRVKDCKRAFEGAIATINQNVHGKKWKNVNVPDNEFEECYQVEVGGFDTFKEVILAEIAKLIIPTGKVQIKQLIPK